MHLKTVRDSVDEDILSHLAPCVKQIEEWLSHPKYVSSFQAFLALSDIAVVAKVNQGLFLFTVSLVCREVRALSLLMS